MQNAIINVNGQITAPGNWEEAKVSVFDRGYLYGDSLYEVARSYDGKFFLLDQHLKRLGQSASLCRMVLGQTLEHYESEIHRTFAAFRAQKGMAQTEAYCRIIVSRGIGKIGFGLSCLTTPSQYTIIVQPVEAPTAAQYKQGLRLRVATRLRNDRRALDPAMKSGNYLNNLLAYLESVAEDFDDCLLANAEDHITEGSTFNIFYVRRGIIATPPLDVGILEGITRRHVLGIAESSRLPVRIVRFPKERLYEADEVFLTSSIKEVFPVTQVDQVRIGNGAPGPITNRLAEAYRQSRSQ